MIPKRIVSTAVSALAVLTLMSACGTEPQPTTVTTGEDSSAGSTTESYSDILSEVLTDPTTPQTAATGDNDFLLIDMTIFERNSENALLTQTAFKDLKVETSFDKSGAKQLKATYTAGADANSVTLSLILGMGGVPSSASGKVFYRADGGGTYESNCETQDGGTAHLTLTVAFAD